MRGLLNKINDDLYPACAAFLPASALCGAEGYTSVLVAVFPYLADRRSGNLSLYARSRDYHGIVCAALERVRMKYFSACRADVYCDVSPVCEQYAAAAAGLGVLGRNGLLITPEYGSFVFIGEILSDMRTEAEAKTPEHCTGCGACDAVCPSGNAADKTLCVSHISQKKGELTTREAELLKKSGYVWGCDLCQLACPKNRGVKINPFPGFETDLKLNIIVEDIEAASNREWMRTNRDRAYSWRGRDVLRRNLRIFGGNDTLLKRDMPARGEPEQE